MKKDQKNSEIIIPGFQFAGISAGIKKSGEKDLALIFSEKPATTAGVFTSNKVKAAPVRLAIELIPSHMGQAVIINSGNANACTGREGIKDAREVTAQAAVKLGISRKLVYVSSTGIIGKRLPVNKIVTALPELVNNMTPYGFTRSASAIMTTDAFMKSSSKKIKIGTKTGTIAAMAKGAGMICPNMATMLCFILTDISLTPAALDSALREAVNKSFNMLSVDNDMSTNDSVMIMANGVLGNKSLTKKSVHYETFKKALCRITYELAVMIAEDGEGATKLIEVIVKGAKTESDAIKVAKSVSNSMLVKTAVYGRDPNWGRIMAAIGYSGADILEHKIDVSINNIKLVKKGLGTNQEESVRLTLANKKIVIAISLGAGKNSARHITCDLNEGYIKINAHYGT